MRRGLWQLSQQRYTRFLEKGTLSLLSIKSKKLCISQVRVPHWRKCQKNLEHLNGHRLLQNLVQGYFHPRMQESFLPPSSKARGSVNIFCPIRVNVLQKQALKPLAAHHAPNSLWVARQRRRCNRVLSKHSSMRRNSLFIKHKHRCAWASSS